MSILDKKNKTKLSTGIDISSIEYHNCEIDSDAVIRITRNFRFLTEDQLFNSFAIGSCLGTGLRDFVQCSSIDITKEKGIIRFRQKRLVPVVMYTPHGFLERHWDDLGYITFEYI